MTIDERLEFLLKSTESLHESVQKNTDQIADLTRRADAHEREIERFRSAMRAALAAWLDGGQEQG
jgi:prefoldin subunit 5